MAKPSARKLRLLLARAIANALSVEAPEVEGHHWEIRQVPGSSDTTLILRAAPDPSLRDQHGALAHLFTIQIKETR
jgi:hypothetical protein